MLERCEVCPSRLTEKANKYPAKAKSSEKARAYVSVNSKSDHCPGIRMFSLPGGSGFPTFLPGGRVFAQLSSPGGSGI